MSQNYQSIADLIEPLSQKTLGELRASIEIDDKDDNQRIQVTLGALNIEYQQQLKQQLRSLFPTAKSIDIVIEIPDCLQGRGEGGVSRVRCIIAVASGKGGVGKSATAANLALALQQEGARVGLLDADIYGPSVPVMLGCSGDTPVSVDGKRMQPILAHNLYINSMGFFMKAEQAAAWRGPMASGALQQLIRDTDWPELDYLIVDMPPGTGDIQLTLSQKVPISAAVVVTTPQDLALADARRGIDMFRKVNVEVAGIVENMSYFKCPCCDHKEQIFGEGGGAELALESGTRLLGQVPIDAQIRADTDGGNPTVIASPDSDVSAVYRHIARELGVIIWQNAEQSTSTIPTISIED